MTLGNAIREEGENNWHVSMNHRLTQLLPRYRIIPYL